MYNIKIASEEQIKLQQETGYPDFAPKDGKCWSCGLNIYLPKINQIGENTFVTGKTVKEASESLITGCPHCNKSYCD